MVLERATTLTELNLRSCMISAEGMEYLTKGLSTVTTLKVLDLSNNLINSEGVNYLGKLSVSVNFGHTASDHIFSLSLCYLYKHPSEVKLSSCGEYL